jgi:hypothetical protein
MGRGSELERDSKVKLETKREIVFHVFRQMVENN